MHNKNRRKFLNTGVRTLCGAGLALGSSPWHTLAHAALNDDSNYQDYRALVCVYLEGGMDGFSMLVPVDGSEYNEYQTSRQHLSIDQGSLIGLSANNTDIPNCGLHPNMAALKPLYDQGQLAFLANVGTLIEPTTREMYENRAVKLPAQLFSHSDQETQWQQLQGQNSGKIGWGALAAEQLSAFQERDYLTSITLSGANYWQSGDGHRPFSMRSSGLVQYQGMDDGSDWQQPRVDSFKRVSKLGYSHLFMEAYADLQQRAGNITAELGQVLEQQPALGTTPPAGNGLAAKLEMVAKLIASQQVLGMKRQIFYVSMDGWDVHDAQQKTQPQLFSQLAESLSFFQSAMSELGMTDNVTTFTASDFGRSLTSNGDGTDHGWGNHHVMMGGAVNGADIYGTIPRMSVDGPDAVRNGRIVPTLSASQYAATLLRWAGLNESGLNDTLPDLGNFNRTDLGFLKS